MTRKEIIDGLKFTVEMFLFDANTGETFTEPRNDMDKTTIDSCKGAIELLEKTDGDLISRDYVLSKFKEQCDRCGKYKENNGVMCRCCALDDAIGYVEDAPSAEKTEFKAESEEEE